jgi:hypothetical protein
MDIRIIGLLIGVDALREAAVIWTLLVDILDHRNCDGRGDFELLVLSNKSYECHKIIHLTPPLTFSSLYTIVER